MTGRPDKFLPALYGGIIIALVSTIPFVDIINCFCCAGILGGGLLAVYFYKNNIIEGMPPLQSADCLIVGMLAGIIGAFIGSFLHIAFLAAFGNVMMEKVIDWLHRLNVNLPEDAWNKLEQAASRPEGVGSFMIQLFSSLFLYGIFGLLGGLIGYSIFKPRVMPLAPPPPPPSPPPSPPPAA